MPPGKLASGGLPLHELFLEFVYLFYFYGNFLLWIKFIFIQIIYFLLYIICLF